MIRDMSNKSTDVSITQLNQNRCRINFGSFMFCGYDVTIGNGTMNRLELRPEIVKYDCDYLEYIFRFFYYEVLYISNTKAENIEEAKKFLTIVNQFVCDERIAKGIDYGEVSVDNDEYRFQLKEEEYEDLLKRSGYIKTLQFFLDHRYINFLDEMKLDLLLIIHKKVIVFIDKLFKVTGQWCEGNSCNSIIDLVKFNVTGSSVRSIGNGVDEVRRVVFVREEVHKNRIWECLFFVVLMFALIWLFFRRG